MKMPEWANEPMALAETEEWERKQGEEESRRAEAARLSERFSLRLKKWGVPHHTSEFIWKDAKNPSWGVGIVVDGIGFALPSHPANDRTGLLIIHEALKMDAQEEDCELYCQSLVDLGNALRIIAKYQEDERL